MNHNTYFEHGYALLIGIRYGHWQNVSPLNGTLRDVEDIHAHFLHSDKAAYKEGNVIALTEGKATTKGILDALDELVKKTQNDPGATVIVYYAGHGETDGQNYFFVPYDFDLEQWQNHKTFDENKVVVSKQFVEKIDKIQADKKLIILDCCHSENIVKRSLESRRPSFLEGFVDELDRTLETHSTRKIDNIQLKKGSGSVILTSCEADETSLDIGSNGLFTQVLLECLNGEKNIEQDGWVRLIDLMRYVPGEVVERAANRNHEQHPVFKRIENLGHEDFIICAYNIVQARGLRTKPVTESKPVIMDYEYINDFIRKGKVEKAIGEARTVAYQIKNNDAITEVDALSQRYSTNERKQRLGVLSNDKYNEERNKITFALLELIDNLNVSKTLPTPQPSPSVNPNKDKIIALIDSDIDSAFDMLDEIFGTSNGIYNDFNNEYFSRSDNFNMQTFRSKLKRFVKRNL